MHVKVSKISEIESYKESDENYFGIGVDDGNIYPHAIEAGGTGIGLVSPQTSCVWVPGAPPVKCSSCTGVGSGRAQRIFTPIFPLNLKIENYLKIY